MDKSSKTDIAMIVISVIIALVGFIILLRSVNMGLSAATNDMIKAGGMSGEEITIRRENHIATYRLMGGIMLGIGLLLDLII